MQYLYNNYIYLTSYLTRKRPTYTRARLPLSHRSITTKASHHSDLVERMLRPSQIYTAINTTHKTSNWGRKIKENNLRFKTQVVLFYEYIYIYAGINILLRDLKPSTLHTDWLI